MEVVDHSQAHGLRRCLRQLVDFLKGGIEAAVAFDSFPVGAGDSLAENEQFSAGLSQISAYPGLQHPLGAVQEFLLPSHRKYFDSPSSLSCHLSMRPMELANRAWVEMSCTSSCSAALVCLPQTKLNLDTNP